MASVYPNSEVSMRMFITSFFIASLMLGISFSKQAPQKIYSADSEPSEWKHYTMNDLDVDVSQFKPIRGRYLQVMLDLEGNETVQSRSFVHLELDRAIHSGLWDGQYPATMMPWREPGLVVDWKIQNSVYNGYDRVLTDSRMSTIQRAMPAGPYGLLTAATLSNEHSRIRAPLGGSDSSFAVNRRHLPHGAMNVLTLPYVLSAMDLQPGQRFTLPGFALIGGPEGTGRRWRGAFEVKTVAPRMVRGKSHDIAEVIQWAVDRNRIDSLAGDVPPPQSGQRITRYFISDSAPYFMGRGDYLVHNELQRVRIREQLDLVDWAPIPLPSADLVERDVWDIDSTTNIFMLKPQHIPEVLLPRD